jgi:general secretion pathway protein G
MALHVSPCSGGFHHAAQNPTPTGFTLLELLVVLVVLGLLAGIVAPKYFSQLGRSEAKVARAQIEGLSKALDLYRLEVGHYPSSEQGLQALVVAPSGEARWTGPTCRRPCRKTRGAALHLPATRRERR